MKKLLLLTVISFFVLGLQTNCALDIPQAQNQTITTTDTPKITKQKATLPPTSFINPNKKIVIEGILAFLGHVIVVVVFLITVGDLDFKIFCSLVLCTLLARIVGYGCCLLSTFFVKDLHPFVEYLIMLLANIVGHAITALPFIIDHFWKKELNAKEFLKGLALSLAFHAAAYGISRLLSLLIKNWDTGPKPQKAYTGRYACVMVCPV